MESSLKVPIIFTVSPIFRGCCDYCHRSIDTCICVIFNLLKVFNKVIPYQLFTEFMLFAVCFLNIVRYFWQN